MNGYRKLLGSKIHRATVTHADLQYEGSITLSPELIEAANFMPHEAVQIWNATSGTRLETYVIEGRSGSRDICINGAAAHLVKPGDLVIIARFIYLPEEDCSNFEPVVVFVDECNSIVRLRKEIAGPSKYPSMPTRQVLTGSMTV